MGRMRRSRRRYTGGAEPLGAHGSVRATISLPLKYNPWLMMKTIYTVLLRWRESCSHKEEVTYNLIVCFIPHLYKHSHARTRTHTEPDRRRRHHYNNNTRLRSRYRNLARTHTTRVSLVKRQRLHSRSIGYSYTFVSVVFFCFTFVSTIARFLTSFYSVSFFVFFFSFAILLSFLPIDYLMHFPCVWFLTWCLNKF